MSNTFGRFKGTPTITTVGNSMQYRRTRRAYAVGGSGGITPVCTDVNITAFSGSPDPAVVGSSYTGTPTFVGSAPVTFSITVGTLPTGLSLNTSTGVISGTPSGSPGTSSFTLHGANECPSTNDFPTSIIVAAAPPTAHLVRWGLFVCPNLPSGPPTFVPSDFTGSNVNYTELGATDPVSCIGSYHYTENAGARQILIIADSLTPVGKFYRIGGFLFTWFPADNTPNQSLVIAGVPCKVFVSNEWNLGAFNIDVAAS